MSKILEQIGSSSSLYSAVGIIAIGYVTFKLALSLTRGLLAYFLGPALRLNVTDLKKAGAWAVVTGCTDGIGKAYAQQLARRKLNIVLISRTQQKLDDLAKELESEYGIQTRTVAVDFTQADIYSKIQQGIAGLDVGTLVNNVGMSYGHPEFFVELQDRDQIVAGMLNVNTASVTMLTSMLLPSMKAKRAGYIVNISSSAGSSPIPLLTVYSACKSYVDFFSKGLQEELQGSGVVIQLVKPCFVATKMSKISRASIWAPSPTTYVRSALNTIGLEAVTSGFWVHAIQEWMTAFVPTFMVKNAMLKARSAYLRKEARKKAQE